VKFKPKTKLRIIVLVHQDLIPPDNVEGIADLESQLAQETAKLKLCIDTAREVWGSL